MIKNKSKSYILIYHHRYELCWCSHIKYWTTYNRVRWSLFLLNASRPAAAGFRPWIHLESDLLTYCPMTLHAGLAPHVNHLAVQTPPGFLSRTVRDVHPNLACLSRHAFPSQGRRSHGRILMHHTAIHHTPHDMCYSSLEQCSS
jgi:hypothetical protein